MKKTKKLKKTAFFAAAIIFGIFFLSLNARELISPELKQLESKFLELRAQAETLDTYAPEKFPDFEELEKINQFVELLDFKKRKFDLLIELYNQIEDKIFPFFLKFSKEHPELNNEVYVKVIEYTAKEEKSILLVQEKINVIALQIERLKKKIERVQLAAMHKELEEEEKQKLKEGKETVTISAKIDLLEEKRKNLSAQIVEQNVKLKELKEKEKKGSGKIKEKRGEISEFEKKSATTKDKIERLINQTRASVRDIRLNGLEIPRLNTIKTFVYLTENNIETLEMKVKNIDREIISLKKRWKKELKSKILKSVLIIVIALFALFLIIKTSRRISRKILGRIEASEKIDAHRKQRYQTLSSVILSFIRILAWAMAVLWILGQLEIDYAPFLVAAGGISLAIGFGAQSLVKDVVTGFFLLMEEQFALGDCVEINGKTGTIEKISLRTIKFRGLDGTLHIIPNGSIANVSNQTYLWSRVVLKFGVSYEENSEKVLNVLKTVCKEMAADPQWKDLLIEEPVPQGILSFGDSAVGYRVLAKTKPGDQWAVERELHVRIKNAFDKNGIEIPYNYMNIIDRTEKK